MSIVTAHTTPARYRPLALLLLVASLAMLLRFIPTPRTIDDAFITFRYSRNIVEGHGFVYNVGSRTLGTTTPLFTLLMAGISFVSGSEHYPWFALTVSAIADAITAVLLCLIAFQLTGKLSVGVLLGSLWAVSPMSVTFAVGGMETSVAILWCTAAACALLWQRQALVGLFAALSILTRVDTLICISLLLIYQLVDRWHSAPRDRTSDTRQFINRLPWKSWLCLIITLTPWYVFSWVYFGTLLPRSLRAKTVAYVVSDMDATVRLLQHLATPFFDHEIMGSTGIVIGLILYPSLVWIATVYAIKRHRRIVPFLLFPWVYVAVFSLMNPVIFRWYLAPILPAYFLGITVGSYAFLEALTRAIRRPAIFPVSLALVGTLFIGFSLNAWTLKPDHGPDHPAPEMAWHQIELYYRDMSNTLRREYGVTEDTLIAAGDIGAVGFYSRARILDTVGLITPEVSDYYPLDKSLLIEGANYAVPPAIVFDYEPDYIIFMEMFVRNGLARDPRFAALYDIVDTIPTDFYGTGMILYQRHDLASRE